MHGSVNIKFLQNVTAYKIMVTDFRGH